MHKPIKILSTILTLTTMMLFAYQTYAQDGAFDPDFTPTANGQINAIAVQSSGNILIGGSFTTFGGLDRIRFARLNINGTLDTSFPLVSVDGSVQTIAIQTDGKILIAGFFTSVNGATRNGIARLNADGTLDEMFDPNVTGRVLFGFTFNVQTLALQTDGKILIGGLISAVGTTPRNNIARLHADGTLDDEFNPNVDNDVRTIALTPDNKILIGGLFNNIDGMPHDNVARLNASGTIDDSFNSPGLDDGSLVNGTVESFVVQSDGKVIIGGLFSNVNGTARDGIARLNTNGSLDTSFNTPNLDNISVVTSVVLQRDNKVLVGGGIDFNGTTTPISTLVRLNSNGNLDTNFAANITGRTDKVVLQPADDNILVSSQFFDAGNGVLNNFNRLENDIPPPNQINFVTTTLSQAENNSEFEFLVSRAFPSSGDLLVNYTVTPGTNSPVDADDFDVDALPSGVLTFADGDTMQNISIQIANDTLAEQNETFIVTLTVPDNATLGIDQAQATILDDDDVLCLPIPATNGNMAVVCL